MINLVIIPVILILIALFGYGVRKAHKPTGYYRRSGNRYKH